MSSDSPQPGEQQEVTGQNGAEEGETEKPVGGKGMLEHQPDPQQPQPGSCDQGRSSESPQSAAPPHTSAPAELRLVLLGRAGSGKIAAGNAVLGREEFQMGGEGADADTQECEKRRGTVAGRQVAVVNTPDWFSSPHPPEVVVRQLSACAALAAPGPHAFLLCVALDQPAEVELRALGPLEEAFGRGAMRGHALVLFTHAERLAESEAGGQRAEDYIVTRRPDLLQLVEKCGERFHVLQMGGGAGGGAEGAEGAEQNVRELLEKVELLVEEAGNAHHTSGLFQQAEARVRQRQEEIAKERRERERGGEAQGEEQEEKEREKARHDAERSAGDLQLDRVPALWLSDSSDTPPSLLLSLWETLASWLRAFLKFIRGGSLVGGFVRVLVGGPIGRIVGAAVGSVVTEVDKRKQKKLKEQ